MYDEEQNNHRFIEPDEERKNTDAIPQKQNLPFIVTTQLRVIGQSMNTDFFGGDKQRTEVINPATGMTLITDKYIPNTRAVFCNNVAYLYDIMECLMSDEELSLPEHPIHAAIKEVNELPPEQYDFKAVQSYRKLLRHMVSHLRKHKFYSGYQDVSDGIPFDWQDWEVDEEGIPRPMKYLDKVYEERDKRIALEKENALLKASLDARNNDEQTSPITNPITTTEQSTEAQR